MAKSRVGEKRNIKHFVLGLRKWARPIAAEILTQQNRILIKRTIKETT